MEYTLINGFRTPVYRFNTCVVGSGAAGLNCADTLFDLGQNDIAIVTEGINMGTSRNTGSDKQTYYKLTTSGNVPDSVDDMAQTYFSGGCMHGDLALIEASSSLKAFYKLCGLGVPFPYNEYGEYVGYRTDHDERRRATSCGPLTSKYMTEALEKSVRSKDIRIFDGYRVFEIFTENGKAIGFASICPDLANDSDNRAGLCVFMCRNIVWAVGGPSAIYSSTVYPKSQSCAHGMAFRAGAEGVNVTESQYGIASLIFRWNLSGSYQQVIPRYFSLDSDGEHDFLVDTFQNRAEMLQNIFLKGYQWPFDPMKLEGSSKIDLAIYGERLKGRRVFMDFRRDPDGFDTSLLSYEALAYLENSGAVDKAGKLIASPIKRLEAMNRPAIDLYASHGIDLYSEPLEIDVCAQHNNGGLAGNTDYESTSLSHFFVVGEANGLFGIKRPGGSALNSTQVSSWRAALKITSDSGYYGITEATPPETIELLGYFGQGNMDIDSLIEKRAEYAEKMSRHGAFIRDYDGVCSTLEYVRGELDVFFEKYKVSNPSALVELSINYDVLTTQLVYLSAIREYIEHGGKSRGSYLINGLQDCDTQHSSELCYVRLDGKHTEFRYESVRPIPKSEQWFEKVYNNFMNRGK